MTSTFILATGNRHKAQEIQAILGPHHRYLTLAECPGAPDVVEDAATFAGNALKKAGSLAAWLAQHRTAWDPSGERPASAYVLADDSGLEVDALDGAPGVHSARFAALDRPGHPSNVSDMDNNRKLLRLLDGVPDDRRRARFRCVLALVPVGGEGEPKTFDGTCEGCIRRVPRGDAGFGYDPLFVPEGLDRTFAELGEAEKNRISHRSRALASLKSWLTT